MKYSNWTISNFDREAAIRLCRMGLNPLMAVILVSRGIKSKDKVDELIGNNTSFIGDPFLLEGMEAAVSRINRAISSGEHIAVYGDYDVDGITSTTLLAGYFNSRGVNCSLFIPERLTDGYGVKAGALEKLKSEGVDLVITVDCGITAVHEVEFAKNLGLDIIITDHHKCPDILPDAVAVIDPARPDSKYPFSSLAGVGVAFKLICALENDTDISVLLEKYGGITALGTVADVMPVTYENRVIIKYGLKTLNSSGHLGIKCLCEAAGIAPGQITVSNLGYVLAPRLNAAGRLGFTHYAVDLLMTNEEMEARRYASDLCRLNKERQQLESQLIDDATIYLQHHPSEGLPLILSSETWHQGVAGIAASKLAEKFHVPAVVICLSDGIGRGSCRSFGDFNIFKALEHCADLLDGFGGHDMAAGLTIPEENISVFRDRMCEYYTQTAKVDELSLPVDFEVTKPGLLTVENVASLELMEPYGNGNPSPLLCIKQASVLSVAAVGGGKHSKFRIKKFDEIFDCIFFTKSPEELGIAVNSVVDIAFLPQISTFRGRQSVQLLINDLRPS
jgi:single-stranded-DNA-specific exonuclease